MNLQSPVSAIFFILAISVILNLISYVINKYLVYTPDYLEKRKMITKLKKEYDELRRTAKKDSKQAKKMEQKLKSIQKMESELMVKSLKPFLFTFIIFGVIWWWLAQVYTSMGSFVYSPIPFPIIGDTMNFFWWYFLCSLAGGALIKRFLYPEMTI